MKAITSEIERLSNLSDQEFAAVVTKCTKIAKHNAQVMQTKQANYSFPLEFKWAEEIMVDTFAKPRVT
jgi:flagellar motor switch protein FliG